MPSINWAFLCDYAYVDVAGKASIIGIWDNINAIQLPLTWPQMYVIMEILAEPNEEFSVGVIASCPSGKELAKLGGSGNRIPANPTGEAKGKFAFGMFKTKFSETGQYHMELIINGVSVHSIPFTVVLTK